MKNIKLYLGVVILVITFFVKDILLGFLLGGARKKYNETLDKDVDLRKEIDDTNREADILKDKANELKVKDVDEDWHLKDKK